MEPQTLQIQRPWILGVTLLMVAGWTAAPLQAAGLDEHLSRYHDGYTQSVDNQDEIWRKAKIAALGYGAKQGLKSAGVDYRQVKSAYRRATVHSVMDSSAVVIQPNRINFLTRHLDGALVTELSGRTNGDVALEVKLPF